MRRQRTILESFKAAALAVFTLGAVLNANLGELVVLQSSLEHEEHYGSLVEGTSEYHAIRKLCWNVHLVSSESRLGKKLCFVGQ